MKINSTILSLVACILSLNLMKSNANALKDYQVREPINNVDSSKRVYDQYILFSFQTDLANDSIPMSDDYGYLSKDNVLDTFQDFLRNDSISISNLSNISNLTNLTDMIPTKNSYNILTDTILGLESLSGIETNLQKYTTNEFLKNGKIQMRDILYIMKMFSSNLVSLEGDSLPDHHPDIAINYRIIRGYIPFWLFLDRPSDLKAYTNSSSISDCSIKLQWKDNTNYETGYHIERRQITDSHFRPIASVRRNTTQYIDDKYLSYDSIYFYRVRAIGIKSISNYSYSSYSNTIAVHTPSIHNYSLKINKIGTGNGTIVGYDIDAPFHNTYPLSASLQCGLFCQKPYTDGQWVKLIVIERSGSIFHSWNNCDIVDGKECYVQMNQNKAVFARFDSFSLPLVKIINETHYNFVNLKLNGIEVEPRNISPGTYIILELSTPDTVIYDQCVNNDLCYHTPGTLSYDICSSNNHNECWFRCKGTVSLSNDQTKIVRCKSPSIGQVLAGFNQQGRSFKGSYRDNNSNDNYRFHFKDNNEWSLYYNGTFFASGFVDLVSWQNYSDCIKFKLEPNNSIINICHPFTSFEYKNTSANWPEIEYVAQ